PLIDEIIILSTTVQRLEVDVAEKIITQENQDLRVSGFIIYRIEDPVKAYQAISGTQDRSVLHELNKTLEDLVESIIRTTVASLSLDQVLRERSLIIEAIMSEMVPVVSPMGIQISTAEIRHVEVLDQGLFEDLQEDYRQEARLRAEQTKIETQREVAKSRAEADQDIRSRELQRDDAVLMEQQKVQETEEKRRSAIETLQKEREAKVADLDKKKLEIEAQTRLMEIEFEAESNKRRQLLETIDIQAEQKKRMAEADAEAIRVAAIARKEAVELDAEAEATKLRTVAEAMKESLLAEAEGRKALLLAEAEGLREKVKAQGYVNESMIMQELVRQLPHIASSMKVGDINWLNMGGGESGDTPLGIIPKNLTQIMALSKSFGLDIEDLVRTIRGQSKKNGNNGIEVIEAVQDEESGES
ncbi:MAG: SPFH domain-containing protein, partial [Candidatus Kariarchaeaceae archaeon]